MPRLSIIIPFSKDVQQLEESLVSVLENRPRSTQVLVVLGDVYKDPYDIKDEVDFVFASYGESVVECLNLALDAATAPVVHVLGCGMQVSPGWTDAPLDLLRNPTVASVVPCILDKRHPAKVLSAGVHYRSGGVSDRLKWGGLPEGFHLGTGECFGPDLFGGFFRRNALRSVGGFNASLGPVWGVLDPCLQLRQQGYETRFEPASELFADETLLHRRQGFRQALEDERFFWRWAAEAGTAKSIFLHTFALTAETVCGLVRPDRLVAQWAGRLAGAVSAERFAATAEPTIPFPRGLETAAGVESRRRAA